MNIIKLTNNRKRLNFKVQCSVKDCGNIQDFDDMSLVKATNSAIEAGWNRNVVKNKVKWKCPECLEMLKS